MNKGLGACDNMAPSPYFAEKNMRNYGRKMSSSPTITNRRTITKTEVMVDSLPLLERTLASSSMSQQSSIIGVRNERNRINRQTYSRGINRQNTRRDQIHLGSINSRTSQGFPQEMKLPRQCLDCGAITQAGKSRCAVHHRAKRKVWDRGAVLNRKRRMQNGDGAAARLRAQVNREGGGYCTICNDLYPAPMLNVDHIIRMANGGSDTDDNLQILCKYHHNIKNRLENSS